MLKVRLDYIRKEWLGNVITCRLGNELNKWEILLLVLYGNFPWKKEYRSSYKARRENKQSQINNKINQTNKQTKKQKVILSRKKMTKYLPEAKLYSLTTAGRRQLSSIFAWIFGSTGMTQRFQNFWVRLILWLKPKQQCRINSKGIWKSHMETLF